MQVKIGKTTYDVIADVQDTEYRTLKIQKGSTVKTLILNLKWNEWTLWSARNGMSANTAMPKTVQVELIGEKEQQAETVAQSESFECYRSEVNEPATQEEGLQNFVQLIINSLCDGNRREAILQAVDLLDDLRGGIYKDKNSLAQIDALKNKVVAAERAGYEAGYQDGFKFGHGVGVVAS